LPSGAAITVVHTDADAVDRALYAADPPVTAGRSLILLQHGWRHPDLPRLRALCDAHGAALIVDEAHALGVFGPRGAGLCAETGVRADVLIGTLGKALGLHGAFVAGSATLRTYLWNRARSFVFSTGISPALASAAVDRISRAAADDAARARLAEASDLLRAGLSHLGARLVPTSRGPIVPWLLETPAAAVALSRTLRSEGVIVQPIRPPTVPTGTSRLRITASASLSRADLDRSLDAFRRVLLR
jgi:8-amino-7-oxononanoate synthase